MGLAAAMDLSLAVDTAKMGFTEVRIGVAPAMISVLCLPKMRRADAAAAFLRGNRFLAPEADRLGLITAAVPPRTLDDEVDAIARRPAPRWTERAGRHQVAPRPRCPSMTIDEAFEWTGRNCRPSCSGRTRPRRAWRRSGRSARRPG